VDAAKNFHECGFASAVRAHQHGDLTGWDRKVDAPQNAVRPKGFFDSDDAARGVLHRLVARLLFAHGLSMVAP
jgi:hypothetical protein